QPSPWHATFPDVTRHFRVPLTLRRPGRLDALADHRRLLPRTRISELAHGDCRYSDVQIDPVGERPGNASAVFDDLHRCADAARGSIAGIPARTGVRRADQGELRRKANARRRAND